jgi:hypothetical protein
MPAYGPRDFKIVLDPPPSGDELVYHPGSEVTGSLFVKVAAGSPQQFDNIVINLRGEGRVHWTITNVHITASNGISNFYTTESVREANKVYIDLTKTLWSKSEIPDGRLPSGEHSFPFHFVLPPRVPSSHDSTVHFPGQLYAGNNGSGWTRYTLQAHMNRGRPRKDHVRTEKKLIIKEYMDLSMLKLQLPVQKQVHKSAGCCFSCISGTVVAIMTLPKTGFCVNEDIPYRITIENGGSQPVEATATLEECIVYHTRFRKCYPKKIVHGTANNGPVQPGQTTVLTPEVQVLKIPASVIAIMNSTIIKQSFLLKVKVRVPNVIFNPIITCPLVISNGMPEEVAHPEEAISSMGVSEVIPSSAPPPSEVTPSQGYSPSAAPPSYVQSVPSSSNNSVPSGAPIQKVGGSPAKSGDASASSVLTTTEPPSYEDTIKKY